MKPTKKQLEAENAALKAEVKHLKDRATMVARWILTNRSKLTVGKSQTDISEEQRTPLPVSLWMCAQELAGDKPARQMAHNADNAQRKKLNMPEQPITDPWLLGKLG
jgi:hypothetical protein